MSSTSTRASRSRGTLSSSTVGQTCKGPKTRPTEKISKYFAKVASTDDDSEISNDPLDSPYKNCVSRVKSFSSSQSDTDDFKTPKAINKVSKMKSKVSTKNVNAKRKRTRQPQLRKFIQNNLQCSDVNPEHLQMALALSESTYEAENPNDMRTTQEKRESFKAVFEKFGFGYSKTKLCVQNKIDSESKKSRKKSRWRYVTPILKIRTNEEREALISTKVSLILTQNSQKSTSHHTYNQYELNCESLQKHINSNFFMINCLELDQLNRQDPFYVRELGFERCSAPCGCLLKDWRAIPGREPTPERDAINENVTRDVAPPTQIHCSSPMNTSPNPSTPITIGDDSDSENLDEQATIETLVNKSVTAGTSTNQSGGMTFAGSDRLTPPTGNDSSNQNASIKPCGDSAPLTLSDSESLTNGSATISNCRTLSPPLDGSTPPSLSKSDLASRISEKCEEDDSDCYIVDSPERNSIRKNISQKCGGTSKSSTRHLGNDMNRSSKYRLSPTVLERSYSEPITAQNLNITSPRCLSFGGATSPSYNSANSKRVYDCISPDLFASDDDQSPSNTVSPEINRLKGGQSLLTDEIKCYDLTNSDEEEKSLHLRLSDPRDSIDQRSDLNVTEYVHELLSNYTEGDKEVEKISTSQADSYHSQTSICISDEELNYSSVFGTPQLQKKVEYTFSDDENFLSSVDKVENKRSVNLQEHKLVSLESSSKLQISSGLDSSDTICYELSQKMSSGNTSVSNTPCNSSKKRLQDGEDYLAITSLRDKFSSNIPNEISHSIASSATHSLDDSFSNILEILPTCTPPTSSTSFLVKTKSITPVANYDGIDTPKIKPSLEDELSYKTPNKTSPPVTSSVTHSLDDSFNNILEIFPTDTPPTSSTSFLVKTNNVTPMANYDEMDSPKIEEELDKFGLKPIKRKKAAKLLRYIYESTHSVVGDENRPPTKKRRTQESQLGGIIGDVGDEEEIILEKKQSKKVATCPVPLHIAWHNLVMSNPAIRENILLYEPLQLEALNSMLNDQGFRFNIKDLLSFLDKKCVTIRTAQGSHRKRK